MLAMVSAPAAPTSSSPRAAGVFHALSDETRLGILELLRSGERCVCELQDDLDAAQSRLSFHLKVLREAGLVRDRKEGRWSYYSIDRDGLEAAGRAVAALLSTKFERPKASRDAGARGDGAGCCS